MMKCTWNRLLSKVSENKTHVVCGQLPVCIIPRGSICFTGCCIHQGVPAKDDFIIQRRSRTDCSLPHQFFFSPFKDFTKILMADSFAFSIFFHWLFYPED